MALRRREFLLTVPACATSLAFGCAAPNGEQRARTAYAEIATAGPRDAARGTILVCMPETTQTREVWTGLADELGQDFRLIAVRVDGRAGALTIADALRRHRPSGIVLMNNPTVSAYREVQRTSAHAHYPPAVIVMTSFLDRSALQVRGATGISYEVPLITVVTNLRRLVAAPIDRVGVVVREPLNAFVDRQTALASREKIQVIREPLGPQPNTSELKRALRRLKQRVDALWILNDDKLLTTRLITEGWLPGLDERPWTPTIVGAASLVSPMHSFGTFAVLPDHTALGIQAADLLFDIADHGWRLPDELAEAQLPLSTTTTVDLTQVRERFSLQSDALAQVDRILE